MRKPLQAGDCVRLTQAARYRLGNTKEAYSSAIIRSVSNDAATHVCLGTPIAGFVSWSEKDLALDHRAYVPVKKRGKEHA